MRQPLVSVITPLYNRKYLISRCVKSVCNQTYTNLEIIVVDDGSTDEPDEVLAELANDSRVKILRKSNGGVSSARNRGIDSATGEYIMFVDSDDALLPMAVEWCVREAETDKADCVTFAHCHCGMSRKPPLPTAPRAELRNQEEAIASSMRHNRLFAMWNKLYRRTLLGDLRLLPDVSWGEDFIFSFNYLQKCERIAELDCVLINITPDSPSSLNKRYHPQMFADFSAQCMAVYQYLEKAAAPCMTEMFHGYLWLCLMACVRKLCLLAPLSYREKVNEIRRWLASDYIRALNPQYCPTAFDCVVVKNQWCGMVPAVVCLCAWKSKVARTVRGWLGR